MYLSTVNNKLTLNVSVPSVYPKSDVAEAVPSLVV